MKVFDFLSEMPKQIIKYREKKRVFLKIGSEK